MQKTSWEENMQRVVRIFFLILILPFSYEISSKVSYASSFSLINGAKKLVSSTTYSNLDSLENKAFEQVGTVAVLSARVGFMTDCSLKDKEIAKQEKLDLEGEPTRDVDSNSWAIVSLDERVTALEELVKANSSAIINANKSIYSGCVNSINSALAGANYFHGSFFWGLDWHPTGSYIALSGYPVSNVTTRVLKFVDESSLLELDGCKVNHGTYTFDVAWHPSGNFLAICGYSGTGGVEARVYSFDGSSLTELPGCQISTAQYLYALSWSHDGEYLAIGGSSAYGTSDVCVYQFDDVLETLTFVPNSNFEHGSFVFDVSWSPDDKFLAVGGIGSAVIPTVRVLSFVRSNGYLNEKTECRVFLDNIVKAVEWHTSGNVLFAGSYYGKVLGYEFDGNSLQTLPQCGRQVSTNIRQLRFSPRCNTLFVADGSIADGYNISAWAFSGKCLQEISNAQIAQGVASVEGLTLSSDGRFLAAGGNFYGVLDVYPIQMDALTTANSSSIVELKSQESSVASFDGEVENLIGSVFADGFLDSITKLNNALSGCSFVHGGNIADTQWSPDGNYLAMSGAKISNINMRVFSFSAEEESLSELTGCRAQANMAAGRSLDWHPSGSYIALCGGDDGFSFTRIRAYEFSGTTLTEIPGCALNPGEDVKDIQWHPSGNFLAAAGGSVATTYEIFVYEFDDVSKTFSGLSGCSEDHGNIVHSLDWSPSGQFLAVGGVTGTGGYSIRVYEFNDVAKTLTELTGCRIAFDSRVWTVRWGKYGDVLFAGSQEWNLRAYKFDGSNLTVYPNALFTALNDIIDIDISLDGNVILGGTHGGGRYNIFALRFNRDGTFSEIASTKKAQGTGNLRALSIRSDQLYLASAGNYSGSVDLEVYPIVRSSTPIKDNSWASIALDERIRPNIHAQIAHSNTIINLNIDIVAGSNAILAHSNALACLWNLPTTNSNAIVAQSWSVPFVEEKFAPDSNAIISASFALDSHSWSLVNLDEREKANSSAVLANSWAIANLDDFSVSNSCAIASTSFAVTSLDELSSENSWAVLDKNERLDSLDEFSMENSWAAISIRERVDLEEKAVAENSWAIVSLDETVDYIEGTCFVCCSNALCAQSWAILSTLDDLIENSHSIHANSWAFSWLDQKITENSSAIIELDTFTSNSWSILALEDRTAAIEDLLVETSDAVFAGSWAVTNLNERVVDNSWAVASFDEWKNTTENEISENSWAILALNDEVENLNKKIEENSWAILSQRDLTDTDIPSSILDNSSALIVHSWSILNIDE
ncbi:WD40 repeat domain-containing protein, partial [Candidatus Dependentiae bacterium]